MQGAKAAPQISQMQEHGRHLPRLVCLWQGALCWRLSHDSFVKKSKNAPKWPQFAQLLVAGNIKGGERRTTGDGRHPVNLPGCIMCRKVCTLRVCMTECVHTAALTMFLGGSFEQASFIRGGGGYFGQDPPTQLWTHPANF